MSSLQRRTREVSFWFGMMTLVCDDIVQKGGELLTCYEIPCYDTTKMPTRLINQDSQKEAGHKEKTREDSEAHAKVQSITTQPRPAPAETTSVEINNASWVYAMLVKSDNEYASLIWSP